MPLLLLARGWLHGTFDPREGPAAWARGLGPGACSRCRASLALGMTPQSPRTHGSASNCRGASATSAESGARVFRCTALCLLGPQRAPVREPHSPVGLGCSSLQDVPSAI